MRFTFTSRQQVWVAAAAVGVAAALVPLTAQQGARQTKSAAPPAVVSQPAPDRNDYDAIYRIKDEGFQRSKVMEIESWLTDVYGPRLTNSPD